MRQTHVVMNVGCGVLSIADIPLLQATDFIPECCNLFSLLKLLFDLSVKKKKWSHIAGPPVDSYLGYLEPEMCDKMGLVVTRTVAPVKDGCTMARLLNPTGQELKLHPGSHLRVFHHVDDCDILTTADIFDS